ncbi:hypothetical protein [uncultured Croceitalea sp.]|uniref:hypothetical protein n=1 Tax=uncultured Croceitalea sp. TaxID=1798908 RepID=UPI003305CFBF
MNFITFYGSVKSLYYIRRTKSKNQSKMLDKDFISNRYSSILRKLKDKNYLTQSDVDVLSKDFVESKAVNLTNIDKEKAEIVRKAVFENNNRKKY